MASDDSAAPEEAVAREALRQWSRGSFDSSQSSESAVEDVQDKIVLPGEATSRQSNVKEVVPLPGFVVKTRNEHGMKVFINVCGSEQVAAPGNWDGGIPSEVEAALADSESTAEGIRFPLSCAEPVIGKDRGGRPCLIYDVVFNAEVARQGTVIRRLQIFLVEICLTWISQKFDTSLDQKYKLPKMKYMGGEVAPQCIRADPKPLITPVQEAEGSEPSFPLLFDKPSNQASTPGHSTPTRPATAPPLVSTAQSAGEGASWTGQSCSDRCSSQLAPSTNGCSLERSASAAVATEKRDTRQPLAENRLMPAGTASSLKQLKHEVNCLGRPVDTMHVHISMPPSMLAQDLSRVSISLHNNCGLSILAPGCLLLEVQLPFCGSVQGVVATSTSSGGFDIRLPIMPYVEAYYRRKRNTPHTLNELNLHRGAVFDID